MVIEWIVMQAIFSLTEKASFFHVIIANPFFIFVAVIRY